MVELVTRPPEIQPTGFDSRVGSFREDLSGAVNTLARGLGSAFTGAKEQALAQQTLEDQRSLGAFAVQQIDTKVQSTLAAIAESAEFDSYQLTREDAKALGHAARIAGRLEGSHLQNPHRARDTLVRAAELRAAIIDRPHLAKEFREIYGTGKADVLNQLGAVIEDAESRRAKQIEFIDTQSLNAGLDLRMDFSQRMAVVNGRLALEDRAARASAILTEAQASEGMVRIDALNTMRRDIMPGLAVKVTSAVRELVRVGAFTNATPEQKAETIRGIDQELSAIRGSLVTVGGSALTTADIDVTMSELTGLRDVLVRVLNGEDEITAVEAHLQALELNATSDFYRDNPMAMQLRVVNTALLEKAPKEVLDALGVLKGKWGYTSYFDAVLGAHNDSMNLMQTLRGNNAPDEQILDVFGHNGKLLKHAATVESISDNQFLGMVGATLRQYQDSNLSDPMLSESFDSMLESISNPTFLARLMQVRGDERQPQVLANLLNGVEKYVEDMSSAVSGRITGALGQQAIPPVRRGGRGGFFYGAEDVKSQTDWTILDNGTVVFTAKPNAAPKTRELIPLLNQQGSRIGMLTQILTGTSMTSLDPRAVAASIVNEGRLPQELEGKLDPERAKELSGWDGSLEGLL
jgi:hypothetical protein